MKAFLRVVVPSIKCRSSEGNGNYPFGDDGGGYFGWESSKDTKILVSGSWIGTEYCHNLRNSTYHQWQKTVFV